MADLEERITNVSNYLTSGQMRDEVEVTLIHAALKSEICCKYAFLKEETFNDPED